MCASENRLVHDDNSRVARQVAFRVTSESAAGQKFQSNATRISPSSSRRDGPTIALMGNSP